MSPCSPLLGPGSAWSLVLFSPSQGDSRGDPRSTPWGRSWFILLSAACGLALQNWAGKTRRAGKPAQAWLEEEEEVLCCALISAVLALRRNCRQGRQPRNCAQSPSEETPRHFQRDSREQREEVRDRRQGDRWLQGGGCRRRGCKGWDAGKRGAGQQWGRSE